MHLVLLFFTATSIVLNFNTKKKIVYYTARYKVKVQIYDSLPRWMIFI